MPQYCTTSLLSSKQPLARRLWAKRRCWPLWGALICALGSAPQAVWAAPAALGPHLATRSCAALWVQADDASCSQAQCVLDGHAQLRCDSDLRLFADHLEVRLGPMQRFDGAWAQGHVTLVDGLNILRAAALCIDADQIRGHIQMASLQVRRPDAAAADPNTGIRPGRNALIAHGSLERASGSRFILRKADFTLCDCGENCLPSWRVDAPRIEVNLGHRALIWWPQLRLNVANRWLVAVTPPLLPLSLPLTERAAGLLPPQIAFLRVPYPTVDVPLFVPLGPSWDLTVAPGVRTDWGAARLAARLRYAPSAHTRGRLRVGFTHDGRGAMAAQFFHQQITNRPDSLGDPNFLAEHRALAQLTERFSLDWEHATHRPLGPLQLDILANVAWISDDLVHRDLLIRPEQRVAAYLPSRLAVVVRHAVGLVALSIDSMLRLDNAPEPDGQGFAARDYSNVRGAEAATLHRAPDVQLTLLPLRLGPGLMADAQLSAVRYGRWRAGAAQGPTDLAQSIWGAQLGVGFGRQLGPLDVHARAGVDGIAVFEQKKASFFDAAPLTQADVGLRLGRQYGRLLHVIRPQIAYRGVDKAYAPQGPVARAANDALDARLLRRQSQQALFGLQQSLWLQRGPRCIWVAPTLSLQLGQPLDLRSGQLLQPFAEVRLENLGLGSGMAHLSLDTRRFATQPVRELTAQYSLDIGPMQATLRYSRIAPDADRFERSIYELAAPRGLVAPETQGPWAHLLRASLQARLGRTLRIEYTTLYQLPQPERASSFGASTCATPGQTGGPSHCFVSHVARLSYASPCDCWGVESIISGAPQDLRHSLRFQILLSIAGARLDSRQAAQL